ncbi:MAG: hypothetical protein AAF607_12510 [Pseudomonadota bacterium]
MNSTLKVDWFSEAGLDALSRLIEATLKDSRNHHTDIERARAFSQSYSAANSLKEKKSLLLKNEAEYMPLVEQRLAR